MDADQILIAGVGGLGCAWAKGAKARCTSDTDVLLIDADDESFADAGSAHILRLGHTLDSVGCAALPPLAEQRMRGYTALANTILKPVELVILLTGLGGGTGTGAAHEFARQARQSGALVLAVAAMPFEVQETRTAIAESGLARLQHVAHVTVRLSLDRLARQARQQGQNWQMGAEWVEDLIEGLVRPILNLI